MLLVVDVDLYGGVGFDVVDVIGMFVVFGYYLELVVYDVFVYCGMLWLFCFVVDGFEYGYW